MNLREYRKNTHQTHAEDLVLLGKEGLSELNDKIDKFLRRFNNEEKELNLTQKIDGAPALFCWSKYPGYPDNSIALKGFTSGPQNALSSNEQIDAKYGDRPDMAAKLKLGLQLAKYIPAGQCWQGDCLFSKGDLKEENINGKDYLTFMPNKIVYAFSEDNADYNKVKNADFGIAFHTIYSDKDGEMRQGFNVDPTKLNTPNNFYIMSPAINASKDKADYDLSALEKEYNNLKQLEQKLINDPAYEELINNSTFMNYWNTFENANLADKKQVNLNVNTFIGDLKEYVNDKLGKEYNKKLNTVKTDKGRQSATDKYNKDTQELANLIDTHKDTLTNLVNCLNSAANIKMLMWAGLKKAKNDYSTFYKSRTKGYIPSEGEGIAMSDMDGNIVKIVDRSTFSSYNRDPDILSGFTHESLEEDYELNKVLKKVLGNREQEFKQFLKKLALNHRNYDNDVHPLGVYRPERDKGSSQEKVHEFWLKNFGLDTAQRGIGSAIASALIDAGYDINDSDEYKDTLDYDETEKLPADEQFKIHLFYEWDAIRKDPFGDYSDDDPRKDMSFREFLQDKLDSGDYDDNHEKQLIQDTIKEVTGGSGYFKEMMATQMADMGTFAKKPVKFSSKKKLKLEEDDNGKTAVVAFGRFNPPHIGHRKLAQAMANAAKYGEKPKIYLSHKVNSVKDPLSYDSKLRWAQKEWGDLVDVVKSDANNAWKVLEELYNQGYTDIIYAGGDDRIGGGKADIYSILTNNDEHNAYTEKSTGKLLYKFNSISPLNAGERDPNSSDRETQASASLLRKLAIENNFEEFKNYVYLNERDAQAMFKELRHAMSGKEESFLEACNERINRLNRMKVIHNKISESKGYFDPDDTIKTDSKDKSRYKYFDAVISDMEKGINPVTRTNQKFDPEIISQLKQLNKIDNHIKKRDEFNRISGLNWNKIRKDIYTGSGSVKAGNELGITTKSFTPNKVISDLNSDIPTNDVKNKVYYKDSDSKEDNILIENMLKKIVIDSTKPTTRILSGEDAVKYLITKKAPKNNHFTLSCQYDIKKYINELGEDNFAQMISPLKNNFGEVFGATALASLLGNTVVYFPGSSSYPLVDYMIKGKGSNNDEFRVSAKAGSGGKPSIADPFNKVYMNLNPKKPKRFRQFVKWMYENVTSKSVGMHQGFVNLANLLVNNEGFIKLDKNASRISQKYLKPGSIKSYKEMEQFAMMMKELGYSVGNIKDMVKDINSKENLAVYLESIRVRLLSHVIIKSLNNDTELIDELNIAFDEIFGTFIQIYLLERKSDFINGNILFEAKIVSYDGQPISTDKPYKYYFEDSSQISNKDFKIGNKKLSMVLK